MLRISHFLLVLIVCLKIDAQQAEPERRLEIRGISELEMEPLSRATINLYEGTNKVKTVQSGSDGTFSLVLEPNKQYVVEVAKEGLISKRISFNTQLPDEEKGTWMNEFSIGLLKPCNGVDYSILKEPVDRVSFDAKRRQFISDRDYVNNMRPKIEALMIKTDQCQLDTYEELVKKGDQTAKSGNLDEALKLFKQAADIYPKEEYPAKRIAEINNEKNKQQFSAEAYKKIIAEADALSAQGRLPEAVQKYNQAAILNPQESYPKQKVSELQATISQQESARQALLNKEDRYNQAMAKASVAYTKKDYSGAKQFYQEALQIKPEESLPKSRLQEIEVFESKKAEQEAARNAEIAKKQALEKEYEGIVAQADALYKAKKYEEARAAYAKACEMKPNESYPAQRVKIIENAVASEQAAMQKSKDTGYEEAMTAGNIALSRNLFQQARDSYQKALTYRPDDAQAKNQIAETDRLSENFAKQKAVLEQYNSTIQSGDALMAQKNWAAAKEAYNKALLLKPGDKYAITKITAIDNTVAAEQAAQLKSANDSYNAAISAGNNALAQNLFTQAKESYQKALALKPNDPLAKSRIAETDRLSAEFSRQKDIDDQYKKIIGTADGLLASKELSEARSSYMQALSLKPGDAYAQSRVTSIDNTLAAELTAKQKAVEDGYKAAIGAAQTAIAQKTYTQAKEYLQKALTLKPGDSYATLKSTEVDRLIAEQQRKDEQEKIIGRQYAEIISSADKQFAAKEYGSAKTSYTSALQVKPGDPYAGKRITEIDNILAAQLAEKQKQTESAYSSAMLKGSNALVIKDYKAAREAFGQALTVKPGDNTAKQRISETDILIRQEQEKLLAEEAKKKKYEETIKSADQLFASKTWLNARTLYEQASLLYPSEPYAKQRIDEINKIILDQERLAAENAAKENAYNTAMMNAEKYYKARDYVQAKDEYSRALTIKPDQTLPKSRVAEIEALIARRQKEQAEAKARTDAYTVAMNNANDAFSRKDYPAARLSYAEALKQMPGDVLASEQIKRIDYLIAEAEKVKKAEEERKAALNALIASADQAFDAARYSEARENYRKAQAMDPGNAHIKQRIARIDEINRLLAQTPKTNTQTSAAHKVTAAMPLAELNFKNESERQLYLDELKKKYPEGITLEKYKEQYKETYRYIIIRENQAQEYRYVKFTTYNGSQYSVNGKPITQQYFVSQTKTRQGESFKEIVM